VKAFGGRVIVRPDTISDKTDSGLYIPDTAKRQSQIGTVISVGDGYFQDAKLVQVRLDVGDRVVYGKYAGTDCELEGESLVILNSEEVLAIL